MARSVSFTRRRIGPILLVDDYDDARSTLREALERLGYAVLEAANGEQALSLLVTRHDQQVSLVILDLQMPVMDGWRLLELLRCYVGLSSIPVIIVSAQHPHLEQVRHPSILAYVHAPYRMEGLLDLVDAYMANASAVAADSSSARK